MPPHSAEPASTFGLHTIIGRSPSIQDAVRQARIASRHRSPVLVTGPTGTGKELFARGIHYEGPSASEPFIAVNCATLPAHLAGAELFGVDTDAGGSGPRRGLVELAGAGTLFLDEIAELPFGLQPTLLRVLEEQRLRRIGGVDEIETPCRVVAATNRALEEAVDRGEFREDLFYRLNALRIDLPRLRDRDEDILLLAEHFLENAGTEAGGIPRRLSPGAIAAMQVHAWPGNVRELRYVIERAVLLTEGAAIGPEHLMVQRRTAVPASRPGEDASYIAIPRNGRALAEVEQELIGITLKLAEGNQSAAARMLGVSRGKLLRSMKEHGITSS